MNPDKDYQNLIQPVGKKSTKEQFSVPSGEKMDWGEGETVLGF